jgi:hypothetical protein
MLLVPSRTKRLVTTCKNEAINSHRLERGDGPVLGSVMLTSGNAASLAWKAIVIVLEGRLSVIRILKHC